MASLKEIRNRIKSISSTRKITSAMKMVSAAKLKKAQRAIENSLPYVSKLTSIVNNFVSSLEEGTILPLAEQRELKRVAIVVISSNGSLCGAFNSNVFKAFQTAYDNYSKTLGKTNIVVYPIGRKVTESIERSGIKHEQITTIGLTHNLDYDPVALFAEQLMNDFLSKQIDRVEFVYNHFKSAGVQEVKINILLPFTPNPLQQVYEDSVSLANVDYIIEPSKAELIEELLPKVIKLSLFTGMQDSLAAEHAARTTAMQTATDNADELVQSLKLSYNKMRQAAITNEIITIIGGAEAIK